MTHVGEDLNAGHKAALEAVFLCHRVVVHLVFGMLRRIEGGNGVGSFCHGGDYCRRPASRKAFSAPECSGTFASFNAVRGSKPANAGCTLRRASRLRSSTAVKSWITSGDIFALVTMVLAIAAERMSPSLFTTSL